MTPGNLEENMTDDVTALQTDAEEAVLNKKRSKSTQKKYEERKKTAKVEAALEEQFSSGRILGESPRFKKQRKRICAGGGGGLTYLLVFVDFMKICIKDVGIRCLLRLGAPPPPERLAAWTPVFWGVSQCQVFLGSFYCAVHVFSRNLTGRATQRCPGQFQCE